MTPLNRILVLVGGAALIASLTVGAVFVGTNAADSDLQTHEAAARGVQDLGDQLVAAIREQHEAIDEYLLSQNPQLLGRYRQAVIDEARIADAVSVGVEALHGPDLSGVIDALALVDSDNDAWRATFAEPAIAAIQSGSAKVAIDAAIQLQETSAQNAASQFVVQIDLVEARLTVRSDELSGFRVAAATFGVVIELLAAGLSLWFVRRYGLNVALESRRRARASAERIEIMTSLRALRTQKTPEATATLIAEALAKLPGVDVAGVFEVTTDSLLALAVAGLPGYPVQSGDTLPTAYAERIRECAQNGPWAERWTRPAEPNPFDDRLESLGIKTRAFAPIQADGELIGLVGLATTDEDHARHLVEDVPAVGEFASLAQAILVPALVARRDRREQRRRIAGTIASAAFHPVFQPIVDLSSRATIGFEALTRFHDGTSPDRMFASARQCGMEIELEMATLTAAVREARQLPRGAWLSLNVSPALLALEVGIAQLVADTPGGVVLEVTEHETIEEYAPLRKAMHKLGPRVRLSVDDVGAGVANFNHLVELRPSFVKIDIGLVRGVDADLGRRAVVVGLVHFAAEAGCQIIAEGIETEAERATVTELGVTLGQGYLLARPAAAETWSAASHKQVEPVANLGQLVRPARTAAGMCHATSAPRRMRESMGTAVKLTNAKGAY